MKKIYPEDFIEWEKKREKKNGKNFFFDY